MAGPLEGVRVLDMTAMLSGPYATQMLGDLGADVIKIEPPLGDNVRAIGKMRNPNMGPMFLLANRSKRSVVLELKTPEGRDALLRLARTADVFVCNTRPKAMQRLRLAYEDFAAVNPRIIYVSIVGYGQDGPYAALPAYDDLIQGASGLAALGAGAGVAPRYAPVAVADRVAGLNAANAITTALYHRERSGRGQHVEVPMFESLVSMVLADHLFGEAYVPAIGPAVYTRYAKTRRPFPTRDGYICCMIHTDRQWQAFFALAQRPDLAGDPRFASVGSRTHHIDTLYGTVTEILSQRTTGEWLESLQGADIPAMPLHTMETILEDPHLKAVGFFEETDHPTEGRVRTMAVPSRWSGSPASPTRPAPRLGQHTAEVLAEAGFSPDEIERLVEAGMARQGVTPGEGAS